MWSPKTFEDKLIEKYYNKNSGSLFLEVPIFLENKRENARRIDALLIHNNFSEIYGAGGYTMEELLSKVEGQNITIIEAKRSLNRPVIGQVLVAKHLIERIMKPHN